MSRDLPPSYPMDDVNDTYFTKYLESPADKTALKETPVISLFEYLEPSFVVGKYLGLFSFRIVEEKNHEGGIHWRIKSSRKVLKLFLKCLLTLYMGYLSVTEKPKVLGLDTMNWLWKSTFCLFAFYVVTMVWWLELYNQEWPRILKKASIIQKEFYEMGIKLNFGYLPRITLIVSIFHIFFSAAHCYIFRYLDTKLVNPFQDSSSNDVSGSCQQWLGVVTLACTTVLDLFAWNAWHFVDTFRSTLAIYIWMLYRAVNNRVQDLGPDKLVEVMHLHTKITDLLRSINRIISGVTFVGSILTIIYTCYYGNHFLRGLGTIERAIVFVHFLVKNITFYGVSADVNAKGHAITDWMENCISDKEFKLEDSGASKLIIFASQVYSKDKIGFDGLGFFTITAPFLTAVISGMATYTIVITQFLDQDEKSTSQPKVLSMDLSPSIILDYRNTNYFSKSLKIPPVRTTKETSNMGLFDCMRPYFVIGKYLGIFSFGIEQGSKDDDKISWRIESSRKGFVLSFKSVLTLYMGYLAFMEKPQVKGLEVMDWIWKASFCFFCAYIVAAVWWFEMYSQEWPKIFQKASKIQRKFSMIGINLNFRYFPRITLIISIFHVLFSIVHCYYARYWSKGFINQLQIDSSAGIWGGIQQWLKFVASIILNYFAWNAWHFVDTFRSTLAIYVWLLYRALNIRVKDFGSGKLEEVLRLHSKITDLLRSINSTISGVTFIGSIHMVIYSCFYLNFFIHGYGTGRRGLLFLHFLLKTVIIYGVSADVNAKGQAITDWIENCAAEKDFKLDFNGTNRLIIFTSKVYSKDSIGFNGLGFFTITASFLTAVISGIVTYTIVITQFLEQNNTTNEV
ncbi:unnamed protein product [Allacma fusca]|uniref:Gustatory receptor n=1 Tax=Allacma fusca TaxID=39272 RepID=A0A8J2KVH8_9HEXA|nr:unnamed protein product [Allacma fusca]